jgi:branched-chain amino acid aminotransferase
MIGFFKDKFVEESEMLVPIRAKVIQYGLGTFEGVRAYWNNDEKQLYLFRAKDHYKRLLDSCKLFCLNSKYSADELVELTVDLLKKNNLKVNTYIRPLFYHGSTKMAPIFEPSESEFAMYCHEQHDYIDTKNPIRVCISSWRRVSENGIPARGKPTGLYLNSALAREEAYRNGYQEGIFLTERGTVSEGTGEHIFMIKDNILFSPPSIEDNLDGITRKTIIKIASEMGFEFKERSIARTELYTCDELFFVGTGAEVTPIGSVDGRNVSDGSVGEMTKRIQAHYFDIVFGRNKKFIDWCTAVY